MVDEVTTALVEALKDRVIVSGPVFVNTLIEAVVSVLPAPETKSDRRRLQAFKALEKARSLGLLTTTDGMVDVRVGPAPIKPYRIRR